MSKSTITFAVLALSLGAVSAPALAERSYAPKHSTAVVVKPAVAGFLATGGASYTRQLWMSDTYAGSQRSK